MSTESTESTSASAFRWCEFDGWALRNDIWCFAKKHYMVAWRLFASGVPYLYLYGVGRLLLRLRRLGVSLGGVAAVCSQPIPE